MRKSNTEENISSLVNASVSRPALTHNLRPASTPPGCITKDKLTDTRFHYPQFQESPRSVIKRKPVAKIESFRKNCKPSARKSLSYDNTATSEKVVVELNTSIFKSVQSSGASSKNPPDSRRHVSTENLSEKTTEGEDISTVKRHSLVLKPLNITFDFEEQTKRARRLKTLAKSTPNLNCESLV